MMRGLDQLQIYRRTEVEAFDRNFYRQPDQQNPSH